MISVEGGLAAQMMRVAQDSEYNSENNAQVFIIVCQYHK